MDNVFLMGGAAATFVKILVDVCRMIAPHAPPWVFPLVALLISPVFLLAMMGMAPTQIVFNQQTLSMLLLGSVTCAGVAIGASAGQKKADDIRRETP